MPPSKDQLTLQQTLAILRSAGEETRLRLLLLLARGERTVKDLTNILEQSQPRISRHLKLLTQSGLIERYQEGSWVYYRLADKKYGIPDFFRHILKKINCQDPIIAADMHRFETLRKAREKQAQAYFKENASEWDSIRALHTQAQKSEKIINRYLERLIKEKSFPLQNNQFQLSVDLGTGTGHILELLATKSREVIGIDINPEMLKHTRIRLESLGMKHCQLRQGDLYNLPLASECADLVMMHQILHFLENPENALSESVRILKTNAFMMIVDIAPHTHEYLRETQAHQRLGFEPNQVNRWLEKNGLDILETRELPPENGQGETGFTILTWIAQKT